MEVANVRLRLNKVGSDVPLKEVTPAEAMLLHILHGPSNGGMTFGEEFNKIDVIGSAKVEVRPASVDANGKPVAAVLRDRTNAEEYRRLANKYSGARDKTNKPLIEVIWPDRMNPKFPATFKEISWQEVSSVGTGVETAPVNYATGSLATPNLPAK